MNADEIRIRAAQLTAERDEATADAERQTAGMREVALFRAANAQGCLGDLVPALLDVLAVRDQEAVRARSIVRELAALPSPLAHVTVGRLIDEARSALAEETPT